MSEEYASDLDKVLSEMQASIIKDARETFSEEVVNRWLNPKNLGLMKEPDGSGCKIGSCGDTIEIFLKMTAVGLQLQREVWQQIWLLERV